MIGDNVPLVSFIIPVRNDAARLRACLNSIKASRYPQDKLEVIVADNGSTDESGTVARAAGATVLALPHLRVAGLRNQAARVARGSVLAFVDADNEIVSNWTASAARALSDERLAAVGAPYHPPSPSTWVQRVYNRLRQHSAVPQHVEWLGSGNMAVRRSAFDAVGGFDASLETCEDVDLCRKLRARGAVLLADPALHNVHHGDPRTLGDVFWGELWRGRDNMRVSLRAPRSWRTTISAVVPLIDLAALVVIVAGLASGTVQGRTAALVSGSVLIVIVSSRAWRMSKRGSSEIPQALAVAGAYELGRALALGARAGHARRRKGAVAE